MRKSKYNNAKVLGGSLALGLLLLLAASPFLYPLLGLSLEPPVSNLEAINLRPGNSFWLGTDALGHDLARMAAWGALGSLSIGLAAAAISVCLGNFLGAASALIGGVVDDILMRIVDALMSVPSIILLLTLSSLISAPQFTEHWPKPLLSFLQVTSYSDGLLPYFLVIVSITATTWLESARIARARVLTMKQEEYFVAARALGGSLLHILRRHLLPALATTAVVEGTLMIADAIIMESGLSFLGLGLGPSTPSWGSMLRDAQSGLVAGNWWAAIVPGLLICFAVLSVHLLGEGFLESKKARGKISAAKI
jgi:peptide/nickel transport system permease protein